MKLTKQEIKFIDDYLVKNEVKYWDVRLELLDHIVSAVEDKMTNDGISFNEALLDVHRGFGNQFIEFGVDKRKIFETGLYQSNIGFKKFVRRKQKEIGRKQRKRFWKTFPKFLVSARFIVEFLILSSIIYLIHQNNPKTAAIVTLVACYLPEFSKLFYGVFDKSSRKSLMMQMTVNLSALFMSLSYLFMGVLGEYYDNPANKPHLYMTLVFLFLFPFIRHSFNIYKIVLKENNESYKLLTS